MIQNCSSKSLMEVIKERIKDKYGSQENFSKKLGYSRKQLNRLINHNGDWIAIIRICKLLDIKGIQID